MKSARLLAFGIAILSLIRCTGSIPTEGKLPALDGSALTHINASQVAGASATDASTPSSLVQRDAQGNFSAGLITANLLGNATSALFSLGQQGAALVSGGTVKVGTDGNFFHVSGASAVSGFSSAPAGNLITVVFDSAVQLQNNATSFLLQGKGNFLTSPGDLFQFVSLGNDSWREISRSVSKDSVVHYQMGTALSITSAIAGLAYDSVIADTQGEWTPGTGIFKPKQSGVYAFSVSLVTIGAAWTTGSYCRIGLIYPGSTTALYAVFTTLYGPGLNCFVSLSGTLSLDANQSIEVFADNTLASIALSPLPGDNYIRFARLRN